MPKARCPAQPCGSKGSFSPHGHGMGLSYRTLEEVNSKASNAFFLASKQGSSLAWQSYRRERNPSQKMWAASVKSILCCGLARGHSIHPPSPASVWLNHRWTLAKRTAKSWQSFPRAVELHLVAALFASAWSCAWRAGSLELCLVICMVKKYFWSTCWMFSELFFSPHHVSDSVRWYCSSILEVRQVFCLLLLFCSLGFSAESPSHATQPQDTTAQYLEVSSGCILWNKVPGVRREHKKCCFHFTTGSAFVSNAGILTLEEK